MNVAKAIEGIPVVASTTERTTLFATPTIQQRVFNLATGNIERWDGVKWVVDFSKVVSPEMFAAVGDGATDDAVQLQAALDSLPATGGILLLKALYGLGAAGLAVASKSNVQIVGAGPKAGFKILAASLTTVANCGVSSIRFTNCTQSGLKNVYIDNNSKVSNAVAGSANTECFVENCIVVNGALNASIFFVGGTGNRFLRNTVKNSAANSRGMWIGNVNTGEQETDALIAHNYVSNTGSGAGSSSGIGGTMVRTTIIGNRCIGCNGAGIVIAASTTVKSRDVTVSGNVCQGNAFHGIQVGDPLASGDYAEQITVTGNTCRENQTYGIGVFTAQDVAIVGNVCRDNNFDATPVSTTAGIGVSKGKRINITGNTCDDTRAGASRTQHYGIFLNAQSGALDIEDVLISSNICRNNLERGIWVTNSGSGTIDTVAIVGNLATDNGAHGIIISHAADGNIAPVTVVGNTCVGNTTQDLRVDPTSALISDNIYTTESNVKYGTLTALSTTPAVGSRKMWRANNGSATSITTLTGGYPGQEVTLFFSTANTTLVHSAGFSLKGAANTTPAVGAFVKMFYDGSAWFETGRSY